MKSETYSISARSSNNLKESTFAEFSEGFPGALKDSLRFATAAFGGRNRQTTLIESELAPSLAKKWTLKLWTQVGEEEIALCGCLALIEEEK